MIKLELNITLQCNLACAGCNRLCNIYRERTEHMSVSQINKFIDQAKNNGGVSRLKVLGGEPLMHPNFVEIYDLLAKAGKDGIISQIVIESNRTLPMPKVENHSFISWKGRVQRKKKHQPFMWSPKDLGFNNGPQPNCPQISKCGYSLDKYGYLPCSLAIMLTRLYGYTSLYKMEFPDKSWGLEELCPNCIFSMSPEWRQTYSSKTIFEHTEAERTPTKSFKDVMDKWSPEDFYKTQKEF